MAQNVRLVYSSTLIVRNNFILCSFHPYLFFNQDRDTFTFIGFYVTEKGDAMDPTTAETRIPKLMSQDLRRHLRQYSADMWDDYRKWTRCVLYSRVHLHCFKYCF